MIYARQSILYLHYVLVKCLLFHHWLKLQLDWFWMWISNCWSKLVIDFGSDVRITRVTQT
jgi:predicted small integral membrane protein